MKDKKIQEKGITLIALVVTIIILLILVGVTISQITGENGLIRRSKEAVERYKNASEEEQIQLGQLEQYVSDFSIVGGNEGENKASVNIKGLEVTGEAKEQTITVKVTVIGEVTGVEYKINSEEEWTEKDTDGVKKGTDNEIEYTHVFEELELGKSYYIRVKIYDKNEKYVEAISEVITLSYIMTAKEGDVLKDKTYITENGTLKTGSMPNNGEIIETLSAGDIKEIPEGYTSGGTITVKNLREQTEGDANEEEVLKGKKAWVNGSEVTGNMDDYSGRTVTASEVTTDGDYSVLNIPENGYYSTESKIKALSSEIGNKVLVYAKTQNISGNNTTAYNTVSFSGVKTGYYIVTAIVVNLPGESTFTDFGIGGTSTFSCNFGNSERGRYISDANATSYGRITSENCTINIGLYTTNSGTFSCSIALIRIGD